MGADAMGLRSQHASSKNISNYRRLDRDDFDDGDDFCFSFFQLLGITYGGNTVREYVQGGFSGNGVGYMKGIENDEPANLTRLRNYN